MDLGGRADPADGRARRRRAGRPLLDLPAQAARASCVAERSATPPATRSRRRRARSSARATTGSSGGRRRGSRTAGCWRCSRCRRRERQKRHKLRSRLAWLGFGTAAAGVWVAPAHLVRRHHRRPGAARPHRYVDLFRADYLAFGDVEHGSPTWWDLDALRDALRRVPRRRARRARPLAAPTHRRRCPGLRRLRPGANRVAAAALPRPRPAGGAAAAFVARPAGGGPLLRAPGAACRRRRAGTCTR